jgi:hypothetical protein
MGNWDSREWIMSNDKEELVKKWKEFFEKNKEKPKKVKKKVKK